MEQPSHNYFFEGCDGILKTANIGLIKPITQILKPYKMQFKFTSRTNKTRMTLVSVAALDYRNKSKSNLKYIHLNGVRFTRFIFVYQYLQYRNIYELKGIRSKRNRTK